MARPIKSGLDYFPHDVDAQHDEKLEAVETLHGHIAYTIYFKLVERIYRAGGCLDVSASETMQILGHNLAGMDQEPFRLAVETMVRYSLFDATEYEQNKTLTSNGIKKRMATVERHRAKSRTKVVSASETLQESSNNVSIRGERKGKESKLKESKKKEKSDFDFSEIHQELVPSLKAWVEYRKEKKKALTNSSIKTIVEKYTGNPTGLAAAVKQSIENGWQGLFEPKGNPQEELGLEMAKLEAGWSK